VSVEVRNACGKNASETVRIAGNEEAPGSTAEAVITCLPMQAKTEEFGVSAMDSTAVDGSKPNYEFTCYWVVEQAR